MKRTADETFHTIMSAQSALSVGIGVMIGGLSADGYHHSDILCGLTMALADLFDEIEFTEKFKKHFATFSDPEQLKEIRELREEFVASHEMMREAATATKQ